MILTGAGVLGVAFGIAKYVNDFENAKSEIQNLRGQITQLHEVLAKSQQAADGGRIDRLERQLSDFMRERPAVAAALPAPTPPPPAPVATPAVATVPAKISAQQITAGFDGSASDGTEKWPFRIQNVKMGENGQFEAIMVWSSFDSEHKIRGRYTASMLYFKEVAFHRKGKNEVLGCEYTLEAARTQGHEGIEGIYKNCAGTAPDGKVSVSW